ncbi:MAG TPA: hypothetical protein DCQ98_12950 [Planctomycetaceae bacterium]|nr:hypothetical protein [Planctomycetaceae bacterium]
MRRRASRLVRLLAPLVVLAPSSLDADQLVLSDLTSLVDVTVAEVDADGVLLIGARRIGWDRLRGGEVAPELQEAFDRHVVELGVPLRRLRYRLTIGDYRGLAEGAEALAPLYAESASPTAALVRLAAFRGHLESGRRAAAFGAWLALQRTDAPSFDAEDSRLPWPAVSQAGLWSPELPPVWFDTEEATAEFDQVAAEFSAIPRPTPTARLLFASLAIAAGRSSVATEQIAAVTAPNENEKGWIEVLKLSLDRSGDGPTTRTISLRQRLPSLTPEVRPLALYELATARLADRPSTDITAPTLDLLAIPAEYPTAGTDLIGAALHAVVEASIAAGRTDVAQRVREELERRHARSWHVRFRPFPR